MMQGKRRSQRRETLAQWPVKNAENGETVGWVINISDEGMQIQTRRKFARKETLTVHLTLDPRLIGTGQISVVIENVWCQVSSIKGRFKAGFRIIDISERAKTSIRKLMDLFSFPAPRRTG